MELVRRIPACAAKGDLLCVESKAETHLVATGSEAGTVSLIDARDWVLAAQLRPRQDSVTSLAWHPGNEHVLFAACGSDVLELDVRKMSSADDGAVTRTFEVGEEEVNHVAVHPRGELLAAANDAGEIAVVKLATGVKQRTLRRVHTNIVSSVAWRPNRATELLTASLDSTAVAWDVSNGSVKRSWVLRDVIADVQLREEGAHNGGQEHSEQSLQMINPPLGHSVAVGRDSHNDRYAAVASGDGSVLMLLLDMRHATAGAASTSGGAPKRSHATWVLGRDAGGHTYSASHVCFPAFEHGAAHVLSCGNDGRILLWDYGDYVEGTARKPTVRAHAQQARKINWAAAAQQSAARMYIADTSPHLACYELRTA